MNIPKRAEMMHPWVFAPAVHKFLRTSEEIKHHPDFSEAVSFNIFVCCCQLKDNNLFFCMSVWQLMTESIPSDRKVGWCRIQRICTGTLGNSIVMSCKVFVKLLHLRDTKIFIGLTSWKVLNSFCAIWRYFFFLGEGITSFLQKDKIMNSQDGFIIS